MGFLLEYLSSILGGLAAIGGIASIYYFVSNISIGIAFHFIPNVIRDICIPVAIEFCVDRALFETTRSFLNVFVPYTDTLSDST